METETKAIVLSGEVYDALITGTTHTRITTTTTTAATATTDGCDGIATK